MECQGQLGAGDCRLEVTAPRFNLTEHLECDRAVESAGKADRNRPTGEPILQEALQVTQRLADALGH